MFQTLSNKVISGVVYLSMVLFSSYEGNEAYFDKLVYEFFNNKLVIRTTLVSSFENDFKEMFKSGQPINIHFNISVLDKKQPVHQNSFMHSVKYDPMARVYYVLIEEKSKKHHVIEDYDVMINLISNIEYNCDVNNADQYKVFLEASLEKIKLESLDKDFDLMTLWKFRKPKLKEKIKKDNNET